MSPVRPGEGRQSPASWGLPSGVLGVGAARFGLPSGSRGMSAVGWSSHCADAAVLIVNSVIASAIARAAIVTPRIAFLPLASSLAHYFQTFSTFSTFSTFRTYFFTLHFELY